MRSVDLTAKRSLFPFFVSLGANLRHHRVNRIVCRNGGIGLSKTIVPVVRPNGMYLGPVRGCGAVGFRWA